MKLDEDTAYCPRCGASAGDSPVSKNKAEGGSGRYARKCSLCGEELPAFALSCPSCGFKVGGRGPVGSISELSRRLDEIEAERPLPVENGGLFAGGTKNYDRFFVSSTDQRKVTLIKNFPIPNTKEDLIELVFHASTNLDAKAFAQTSNATASEKAVSEAWYSKLCQAYDKARIVLADDPCLPTLQKRYDAAVASVERYRKKTVWRRLAILWLVIAVLFGAIFAIRGIQGAYRNSLSPEEQLEYDISQEEKQCKSDESWIIDKIKNGYYKDARNRIYALNFDEELSSDRHEYWEKRKAELLQTVDDAQNGRAIKVGE